jgi:hypothetical protein
MNEPDDLFFALLARQLIPLSEAAKLTSYAEDYLGQRARQGRLKAIKLGRNWITTRAAIEDYRNTHAGPYQHGGSRKPRGGGGYFKRKCPANWTVGAPPAKVGSITTPPTSVRYSILVPCGPWQP